MPSIGPAKKWQASKGPVMSVNSSSAYSGAGPGAGRPGLHIFGAGKMGGALLHGALAAGWPGTSLGVSEPNPTPALRAAQSQHGFALNPGQAAPAGLLLLAIKPQALDAAAAQIAPWIGPETILISILAGKSIANLKARLPAARKIVRAMPNTPAAIGRGITGIFASAAVNAADRAQVLALLGTTGRVEWLEHEQQIDTVTAISGSGPAYVFYLVETLAKAGEQLGLSPELALRLARATIEGAGELLHRDQANSPETLRRNVTSPGGTTAAALEILMAADGLGPLMAKAAAAAEARAKALSG